MGTLKAQRRPFTKAEDAYIRANYRVKTDTEIGDAIGRNNSTVHTRIRALGLVGSRSSARKIEHIRDSSEMFQQIVEWMKANGNKFRACHVADKFLVSDYVVENLFDRHPGIFGYSVASSKKWYFVISGDA